MRVDRIDLYSNDNEIARFDVNVLDVRNPYIIKGITGLDADQIIPRYYAKGITSDDPFYDLSLEPREIAMRIGLNPNYNVNLHPSDLRSDLYRAMASSRSGQIQLRFNDDNSVVGAISGFVNKFEAPLFSDTSEVQITMRCDDPIIKSLYLAHTVVATLDPMAPLLIDPVSTSPHGFKFEMTIDMNTAALTIANATPVWDWGFVIIYPFLAGQHLFFSSEYGDKYLYIDTGSGVIQLMDVIMPGSIWPVIFPGENQFYLEGGEAFTDELTWNDIFWYETHWGV